MKKPLADKDFWRGTWQRFEPKKVNTVMYADLFERYFKPDPSLKCLEIGCFPGNFLIYMRKKFGYRIYGIDYIDKEEDLRSNFEFNGVREYKVFNQDFTQWVTDEKFDIVLSNGFIEHFQDYEAIMEKHVLLLNKGGTLFVSLPNFRYMQFILRRIFDYENLSGHNLKVMNLKFFKKFLEERGFQIKHLGYYGGIGFWVRKIHERNPVARFIIKVIIYIAYILNKYIKIQSRFFSPYMVCVASKTR